VNRSYKELYTITMFFTHLGTLKMVAILAGSQYDSSMNFNIQNINYVQNITYVQKIQFIRNIKIICQFPLSDTSVGIKKSFIAYFQVHSRAKRSNTL